MTGEPWYGKADNVIQNFTGNFTGTLQQPNVLVLHSTEGGDWPAYNLGGTPGDSAPNLTYKRTIRKSRGHYPANRSARALRNEAGGSETNTLNVFQIEIIGTCDPAQKGKFKDAGGNPAPFVPDMDDEGLDDLAEILAWLNTDWDVPLTGIAAPRWKPYPASYGTGNGVRMSDATWQAFTGVCGHQHVVENCVHPDTPLLMGDLTWRRAGDVVTGDRIVGFDEENIQVGSTPGRRFREAFATVHGIVTKDCYRVRMTDGREVVASADHKWLVNLPYVNRGSRIQWVETRHLDGRKHAIKSIGERWALDPAREAGWMAGAIDCDGSVVFSKAGDAAVLFGQSAAREDVMDRFRAYLVDQKFDWYEMTREAKSGYAANGVFTDLRVRGGLWEVIRFLAATSPEKFEAVRDNCWVNRVVGKTSGVAEIESVEFVGPQPVVSLESTSKTYIADGLLCHNTHGDPGNFPIDRLLAKAQALVHGEPEPPPPPPHRFPVLDEPKERLWDAIQAMTAVNETHPLWQFGKDMKARWLADHKRLVELQKPPA